MAAAGVERIEAARRPGLNAGQLASLRARTLLAQSPRCFRGRLRRPQGTVFHDQFAAA
jgi:hypothetical protein